MSNAKHPREFATHATDDNTTDSLGPRIGIATIGIVEYLEVELHEGPASVGELVNFEITKALEGRKALASIHLDFDREFFTRNQSR